MWTPLSIYICITTHVHTTKHLPIYFPWTYLHWKSVIKVIRRPNNLGFKGFFDVSLLNSHKSLWKKHSLKKQEKKSHLSKKNYLKNATTTILHNQCAYFKCLPGKWKFTHFIPILSAIFSSTRAAPHRYLTKTLFWKTYDS